MGGEWQELTWGDLATLEYGKALQGYGPEPLAARVFGTNGPIGWHTKALWDGPGVIIGRKGAYRGVHYSEGPFWVIDTGYSLRPKPSVKLDLRWAYYQIKHLDPNTINDGSPIPSTTRPSFYAQSVLLPSLQEQTAIANLLRALDDKIELNRRIVETLEATARALFTSWFVNFDPFRDKAEGRTTDVLLPDAIEENGLPAGWRSGSIAELAQVNPATPLRTSSAAYVDMAALPTTGPLISRVARRPPASGARFQDGDTLIARITPCLENGKTALVDCLGQGEVGWGSTEFIVLRPREGTPVALPYLVARHPPFREALIAAMSGTSGRQRVQADAVLRWQMAIPPRGVLEAFGAVVSPMFEAITQLGRQSRTLASLRDTLLPKLISGELRIRNAEQAVAEVA